MPTLAIAGDYLHAKTSIEPLLRARLPDWTVVRSTQESARDACVAVCWGQPADTWARLPHVRMVHSIGVGVDGLLGDPALPDVPVCRVIDHAQAQRMAEYVLWATLYFHRGFDITMAHQRQARWQRPANRAAGELTVGVMGLGEIGRHIASTLATLGYQVRGWSRAGRPVPGIQTFGGDAGLPDFLKGTDILVCLLPLTAETEGFLSSRLFAQVKPGAQLIHCGRGPHLVEADLLTALATGQLGGAVIDVFATEPLPSDSALWQHPQVVVTPHMAAVMPMPDVAEQIAQNCEHLLAGRPLARVVNRTAGY